MSVLIWVQIVCRGYMYKITKITAFPSGKFSFGPEIVDVFMQLGLT